MIIKELEVKVVCDLCEEWANYEIINGMCEIELCSKCLEKLAAII